MAAAAASYEILRPGVESLVEESGKELPPQVASTPPELQPNLRVSVGTSFPIARPQTLHFGALKDPAYRLRKAIPLDVSSEESSIVVTWPAIDEFGFGDTLGAALDDFAHTLRELHHRLLSDTALGPDLQQVKSTLEDFIEPRIK
jgi:hypothetical protein